VLYSDAGFHTYTIDNGTLCPTTVELTIEVFDMDIDLSGSFLVDCINSTSTIFASSSNPNSTYYWYDETGAIVNQGDQFITDQPGTYYVENVSPDNTCVAFNNFNIDNNIEEPEVQVDGTYSLNCESSIQLLLLVDPSANLQYTWSGPGILPDQSNLQNPLVSEPGTYTVIVENEFGCMTNTQVEVDLAQQLELAAIPLNTCSNSNDGRIEVKTEGGVGPFLYKLDNESWQTSNVFEDLAPNEYMISIQQSDGCEDFAMAEVLAIPEINPSIEVDQTYELCDTPVLKFDLSQDLADHENWNIMWHDGSQEVERTFTNAGNFSLEISNECEVREFSFFVEDGRLQDELPVYIANIFTPNNDGINDLFECHASETPNEFSIDIFDRWGNKVFESSDITDSWDGVVQKMSGKTDVYAYIANYSYLECDDRKKEFQIIGDVTLIR